MRTSVTVSNIQSNFRRAGADYEDAAELLGVSVPTLKTIYSGRVRIDGVTESAWLSISLRCLRFSKALAPLCLVDWSRMKSLLENEGVMPPERVAELVGQIFEK